MPEEHEMDLTICRLYFHIILATRGRQEWIDRSWRADLHEELRKAVWGVGSYLEAVGGVEDHVHLLVKMRDHYSLNQFVGMVSKATTKWVRANHEKSFAWEKDYSVHSLGISDIPEFKRYIEDDPDRHLTVDLDEELEALFKKLESDPGDEEWP